MPSARTASTQGRSSRAMPWRMTRNPPALLARTPPIWQLPRAPRSIGNRKPAAAAASCATCSTLPPRRPSGLPLRHRPLRYRPADQGFARLRPCPGWRPPRKAGHPALWHHGLPMAVTDRQRRRDLGGAGGTQQDDRPLASDLTCGRDSAVGNQGARQDSAGAGCSGQIGNQAHAASRFSACAMQWMPPPVFEISDMSISATSKPRARN